MTKLHGGALLCGLTLAVFTVILPVPAYAETAVSAAPTTPVTAAAEPSASPSPAATPTPSGSATTATPVPSASSPAPTSGATSQPSPTSEGLGATPAGTASTYIVGFREDVGQATAVLGERPARAITGLDAAVTELTAAEANALADDPGVAYVQKDTRVHIADTQSNAPWGLDRIDQAGPVLDGRYTAGRTGSGVTVYVVDTGIDAENAEFGGRVAQGASFVPDGLGTADCQGHGTAVAGIVAGRTYGVAKQATLVPVRVLGCDGTGDSLWTVSGLNWVLAHHLRGTPAVVNLSLTGPFNKAENDAVKRLTAAGVTVVAAAGNDASDACGYSPGSAKSALTVAASDSTDRRWSQSNSGRCVDLYAPGVAIESASAFRTIPVTMTGTSMASPHVAGAAALLLEAHRSWKASAVAKRLLELSGRNRIRANPSRTPNKLLSIAPLVATVSPGLGSLTGGRQVTVTGSGFRGVLRVLVGGVPATKVAVASPGRIRLRVPAGVQPGAASVRVVTELSDSNLDVVFGYRPAPSADGLSVTAGPTGGGTVLTLTGTDLSGVTRVWFGSRPSRSVTVVSDTELQVVAPAHSSGSVFVRVTTPAGTTAKAPALRFTYGHRPVLKSVSHEYGPTIGGARMRITGSHLSGVTSVDFGGKSGIAVTVVSSKRLYVTVPAHAEGRVEVRLANLFGSSTPGSHTGYRFEAGPATASAG